MKKKIIAGIIVSLIIGVALCILLRVPVPRMILCVPLCAVAGGLAWALFAWLAHVMPFLESFYDGAPWLVNFLWTYVVKPLVCSALVSLVVIIVFGKSPILERMSRSSLNTSNEKIERTAIVSSDFVLLA